MANGTGNGDLLLSVLKMLGEMRIEFKRRAIEFERFEARMARDKAQHEAWLARDKAQHEAWLSRHEAWLARDKAQHEAWLSRHEAQMAKEEKRAKRAELELTTNMRDLALLIHDVAREVQALKGRVTRLEHDAG